MPELDSPPRARHAPRRGPATLRAAAVDARRGTRHRGRAGARGPRRSPSRCSSPWPPRWSIAASPRRRCRRSRARRRPRRSCCARSSWRGRRPRGRDGARRARPAARLDWPGARERHARWREALGVAIVPRADPVDDDDDERARRRRSGCCARWAAAAPAWSTRRRTASSSAASRSRSTTSPIATATQLLHEARVAVALAGTRASSASSTRTRSTGGSRWSGRRAARSGTLLREPRPGGPPPDRAMGAAPRHALARVHAAGWVHHDVKPANVLLARPTDAAAHGLRHRAARGRAEPPGSLGYVSPERLAGRASDPRDDVYGFGRVLEDAPRRRRPTIRAARRALAARRRRRCTGTRRASRPARRCWRRVLAAASTLDSPRGPMPTTYTDLIADVRKRTKQVSPRGAQAPPRSRREDHAGRRAREGRVARRLHPGRRLHPARLPRDPGRAEAPRQERPHRRLLRGRHALGARRGDARRSSGTPTSRRRTPASSAGRTSATRWRLPPQLTDAQRERYSRHILLPEVGEAGQAKLLKSKVLLLGAGGLGSPAALYLAAAGVGTLGIVDADVVDASNLQRQIIHATSRVGMPKVESAAKSIADLNPDVKVVALQGAPDERERRAHLRATTRSSSTGPTTSRRATSSTTRACSWASPSCTGASSASTGR